ncbi:MAG TPA: acyl-CoA dehydrogenase family protein [Solirubrobacteraceae bacterium]|nr:acyl-CoA dehydrogenase family protein [Solirubrobacteraceae bacterium]
MNFDFTDDQHEIKRTARDLLAQRSSFERVRAAAEAGAYDAALWRELRELGWTGIAIGEEHGGAGLGQVELVILLEELGYAVAGAPFLGNALGGLLIEHAGSDEQRARWLPGIASGEATATVGTLGPEGAELVPDAETAALIVLVEDGTASVVERSGAEVTAVRTIDPTRRYARVAPADGEPLAGDVAGALDRCEVALAAELVGVAQRAMEMSVAYAKDRRQFDTPIGAYQAVSHRCAQMLLETEGARSATYFGAWAADADPAQLALGAAMAKASAAEAARNVTASAIQVHGGIGFTWEADVHWLYKRAQVDAALLTGARTSRARVARAAAATLVRG